jgi:predicted nucleic acid-binding Zn ribbon protein
MAITKTKWWKSDTSLVNCVLIGRIYYHKNKQPRVCKHCLYVFPGKRTDKFCSDICREQNGLKRLEQGREKMAMKRAIASNNGNPKPRVTIKVFKPTLTTRTKRHYTPRGTITIKTCPHCNVQFKPKYRKQKYCCVDCTKKAQSAALYKTCGVCGASFKGERRSSKYCSRECVTKASYRPNKICVVCGIDFKPQRNEHLTCSRLCGQTLRNQNNQAKTQKQRTALDLAGVV